MRFLGRRGPDVKLAVPCCINFLIYQWIHSSLYQLADSNRTPKRDWSTRHTEHFTRFATFISSHNFVFCSHKKFDVDFIIDLFWKHIVLALTSAANFGSWILLQEQRQFSSDDWWPATRARLCCIYKCLFFYSNLFCFFFVFFNFVLFHGATDSLLCWGWKWISYFGEKSYSFSPLDWPSFVFFLLVVLLTHF